MITAERSTSTMPNRPSARSVRLLSVAGRPTRSTHSARRCEPNVAITAATHSIAVPPTIPALAIADGSASIPTPIFVLARLAMQLMMEAPSRRRLG